MTNPPFAEPIKLRRRAVAAGLLGAPLFASAAARTAEPAVPILVYHRFAASALDSMTLSLAKFDAQLKLLEQLACRIIPLADWVAWRRGERAALPARAVVLTADDGHRSQWEAMAPRLRERGWPVSLFIYPSAISEASYAMTWRQLQAWAVEGGTAIESHTYWHPNFMTERKRLGAEAFQRFALDQLRRPRQVLQQRLSQPAALLAWPFGLSDAGLWSMAEDCGYRAAFSLGNRSATAGDPLYAEPRHLMVDSVDERQFARRLEAAFAPGPAS